MDPTLLVFMTSALLISASRTSAQANFAGINQTSMTNNNSQNGVLQAQTPGESCQGSNCYAYSTELMQNAQSSTNETTGNAGTTGTATGPPKGSSASMNMTATSMGRSQTNAIISAPTTSRSTAPAQVHGTAITGVAASSVTSATPGGHSNTTGTSISTTTAASAAGPARLWREAHLDVLVAALGALLWRSSL